MPYGEYDYQYYDAGASGFAVSADNLGYVPTQIKTYFTPDGSATEYLITSTITDTNEALAIVNISGADLTAASVGTTNLKGAYRISWEVFSATNPTSVGIAAVGETIYPYNWDVTAYSALKPSGYLSVQQP